MTNGAEQDVELVRMAMELGAEGGEDHLMPRFDELFHEDFDWVPALVSAVDGRSYRGREGFARYWHDFEEALGEVEFRNMQLSSPVPGTVLALCDMAVRGRQSGVPVVHQSGFVFRVREGRIAAGRSFLSQPEAEEAARAEA